MKIGIIANRKLAQFVTKTFDEIGYESFIISKERGIKGIIEDFINCDLLYAHAPTDPHIALLAKVLRKKVMIHWIGTDAYYATLKKKYKLLALLSNIFIDMHLVVSELIQEEIKSIGIKNSTVIPILPKFISNEISTIKQKNKRFTVLTYSLPGRFEFYGGNKILILAKNNPEIDFWILSNDERWRSDNLENIKLLGLIEPPEMDSLYNKSHVLIRNVIHDGTPKMIIEALQKGLEVIYSFKFPYAHHCTSVDQIEEKLYEIRKNYNINREGREYVLQKFSPEANRHLFEQAINSLI